MAEMTETQIIAEIAAIDAKLQTIRSALGGGAGAAQYTSYQLGQLKVDGQGQVDSLLKLKEHFQGLLDKYPKEIVKDMPYEVESWGEDVTDLIGDE